MVDRNVNFVLLFLREKLENEKYQVINHTGALKNYFGSFDVDVPRSS